MGAWLSAIRAAAARNGLENLYLFAVLSYGWTDARYRCVCDEVGESDGTVKFDVPEKQQDGN